LRKDGGVRLNLLAKLDFFSERRRVREAEADLEGARE
jgi:hypothetical protein